MLPHIKGASLEKKQGKNSRLIVMERYITVTFCHLPSSCAGVVTCSGDKGGLSHHTFFQTGQIRHLRRGRYPAFPPSANFSWDGVFPLNRGRVSVTIPGYNGWPGNRTDGPAAGRLPAVDPKKDTAGVSGRHRLPGKSRAESEISCIDTPIPDIVLRECVAKIRVKGKLYPDKE